MRLTASSAAPAGVFIGIAPRSAALSYLNGVAYDSLSDLGFCRTASTTRARRRCTGGSIHGDVLAAEAVGTGTQTLTWTVSPGQWIVVLMKPIFAWHRGRRVHWRERPVPLPLALGLLIGGAVVLLVAVLLLAFGIGMLNRRRRGRLTRRAPDAASGAGSSVPLSYPLRIEGKLDEPVSRWLWLVKWVLLIRITSCSGSSSWRCSC